MHLREPGIDPLDPESHTPVRSIIAVQGTVEISGAGTLAIDVGQAWSMHGSEEPVVAHLDPMPKWVQPSDPTDMTLEASDARKGLMELLAEGDQTLETALREATSFRQSEVAALAGQTLLALGRGDVYFEGSGILNQPKQRAYWPDHFLAIQNIDQSRWSYAATGLDEIRFDEWIRPMASDHAIVNRIFAATITGWRRFRTRRNARFALHGGACFGDGKSTQIKDTTHYYPAPKKRMPYVANRTSRNGWRGKRKGEIRWPE